MRAALFHLLLPAAIAMAGCAPPPPSPPPLAAGEVPGRWQAIYATRPGALLDAAETACADSGRQVDRPSRNRVSCRMLAPPELAAALILSFGGTVEALPEEVVTFSAAREGGAYRVTADSVIIVPRAEGPALQIRHVPPGLDLSITALFAASGGQPV